MRTRRLGAMLSPIRWARRALARLLSHNSSEVPSGPWRLVLRGPPPDPNDVYGRVERSQSAEGKRTRILRFSPATRTGRGRRSA